MQEVSSFPALVSFSFKSWFVYAILSFNRLSCRPLTSFLKNYSRERVIQILDKREVLLKEQLYVDLKKRLLLTYFTLVSLSSPIKFSEFFLGCEITIKV